MSDLPDCIFCKIVRGEIPSARVLETDQALAFLDVAPLNPGHVLLVPREHHASLPDLPDELAAAMASLLPRLCRAVKSVTGAEGLNVLVNTGRVAGQSVDHVHWHIIPRHSSDSLHWPWPAGRYSEGEVARLQAALAQSVNEIPAR
jgi:histidine triad (HIT) family protein